MDSRKEGNLCCPGLDTEIKSIWTIKLILEEIGGSTTVGYYQVAYGFLKK